MHPSLSSLLSVSIQSLLYKIIYSDILILSTVETEKTPDVVKTSSTESTSTDSTPSLLPNGHTHEVLPSQPREQSYPPIPKKLGSTIPKLPQELNIQKRKISEISSRDPESSKKLIEVLAKHINKAPQKRPRSITIQTVVPEPSKKIGKMIRTERIMGEDHPIRGKTRTVEVDIANHPCFIKPLEEVNQTIIAEEPRCDYILKLQKGMMPFKNYKGSLSMEKIVLKAVNRDIEAENEVKENPLDNSI